MDTLRISTMTQVANISTNISLQDLYEGLEINEKISYIGFGYDMKGISTKKKVSEEDKGKRRRYFFNQVTLHIVLDKIINMKVFNNGGIQMTGLKSEAQGGLAIHTLISEVSQSATRDRIFLDMELPSLTMTKMVMINSDFDIGFQVDRETLHREIIKMGYYSSYEPVIYPGVNIKYYHNTNQNNGICQCEGPCDGKGKDGYCKKITVAVFKSGKIIITGGQTMGHIHTAYAFITKFILDRKEHIKIK